LTIFGEGVETGLRGGLETEGGGFEGVPFEFVTTLDWRVDWEDGDCVDEVLLLLAGSLDFSSSDHCQHCQC
jgi:hypothetical protein